MRRGTLILVTASLLGLPLAALAGPASANDPAPTAIVPSSVIVELLPWVRIPDSGATRPRLNSMATTGGRLFVVEAIDGIIYEVRRDGDERTAVSFFDVGAAIESATGRSLDTTNSSHGGLRSVAFHPDFAENGLIYTSVMEERPAAPDPGDYLSDVANPVVADSVVIEWQFDESGIPQPDSYRPLFRVGMPVYDHPIKAISFNPYAAPGSADYGNLYVAHGDGSVQSATAGGGRNNDALGKILRVDPTPSATEAYTVPDDNPFVRDPAMLDEVWSLGHRNPHQLAFTTDSTGAVVLVAAEPGRDNVEEINLIERGGDYGWSEREGTFVHLEGGGLGDGIAPLPADDAVNGYTYPAAQWLHEGPRGAGFVGQAIAGGYGITNGSELDGLYFHSDFPVSGRLHYSVVDELTSAVTNLDPDDPARDHPDDLAPAPIYAPLIDFDHDADPATASLRLPDLGSVFELAADHDGSGRADVRFGQGPDGELYVTSKRNGWVYAVTNSFPPPPDPGPFCRDIQVTVEISKGEVPTEGNDVILGTEGADVIDGLGGNDVICGLGGNDTLNGGAGRDALYGDDGDDTLDGGDDNDRLIGGDGNDTMYGQGGRDIIQGGNGNDYAEGGKKNDRISGNGGKDTLLGGNGKDRVDGNAGADNINGGGGNDRLVGGGGNDTVDGRIGDDFCVEGETVIRCEFDFMVRTIPPRRRSFPRR